MTLQHAAGGRPFRRPRTFTKHAFRAAALFAGVGLLSRFVFRTFETRWQIVLFWGAIALYQFVLRPLSGRRVSLPSAALDAGCVTVAIIAMKVAIEGHL